MLAGTQPGGDARAFQQILAARTLHHPRRRPALQRGGPTGQHPQDHHRPHRRGERCGVQPRRAPAGHRQRRRHGAAVGRRHRPTRRRTRSPATPARLAVWRSAPTGTGWPPPATTTRCGCGTPTPANPSAHPLTGHTDAVYECGVQPRRAPAGQRQRRQHGAAVERRHRPTPRRPPHRPHRRGERCGVQPRRAPAGHRQRRQHGAAVGRRHRPTPRRPADRPHRRGERVWRSAPTGTGWPPPATTARCGCGTPTPANPSAHPLTGHTDAVYECGVQPRRAPAGHRQRRRHGAAVGRRHRPTPRRPRSPATPAR